MIELRVKKLHEDAVVPFYAKEGDAGFDLVTTEAVTLEPFTHGKVSIGLAFEIPFGYEIQVRPRSGVTSKTWLRVQFGTIDSGYRGEVKIMVDNPSLARVTIPKGFRIAQGVLNQLPSVLIQEVDELGESERGAGGFGSTGVTAKSKTDNAEEFIRTSTEGKI